MAEIFIDGKRYNIPEFALDSTMVKIEKAINALANKEDDSIESNTEAVDHLTEISEKQNQEIKNLSTRMKEVSDKLPTLRDRITEIAGQIMQGAESIWGVLKSVGSFIGTYVLAPLGLGAAGLKEAYAELKETYGELTKVGLNLSQGFGEDLAMGTQNVIHEFLGMGLSMKELTGIMANHSFAMAANRKTFLTTTKTFNEVTKSGNNLGLTLAASNEMLADELEFRSRMLYQGQVDGKKEAEQSAELFGAQMKYTKLLGVSVETIRKTAQDVLKNSASVVSLIALQGKAGSQTLTALNSFASGLVASGLSEDFATALVEAGTGIDQFASESTRQLFTTLQAAGVDISGSIRGFRDAVMSESLDVGEAAKYAERFRNQLADMSDAGISQLRLMAAAGDESAKQMLNMVVSAKQAKKSAYDLAAAYKDQTLTGEDIYQRMLSIDTSWSKITGALKNFQQTIMISLAPVLEFVSDVLSNKDVLDAIQESGRAIADAFDQLFGDMNAEGSVQNVAKSVANFIKSAGTGLANFILSFKGLFDTEGDSSIIGNIATGVGNLMSGILDGLLATFLNPKFIAVVAGTLAVVGFSAFALSKILGKLGDPKSQAGATTLFTLSGAVLALAISFKMLGSMDIASFGQGLVGFGVIAATVALGIKYLSSAAADPKVLVGAQALAIISGSIFILSAAVQSLSKLSSSELRTGLLGLAVTAGVAAGMLYGAVKLLGSAGADPKVIAGGFGLMLMAGSIYILAGALKLMSSLSWDDLAKAGVVLGVLIAGIFGLGAVIMSGVGGAAFLLGLAGIIGLAGALGTLAIAINLFPFGRITDMFVSLSKVSEIEPGNLSNIAKELGTLMGSLTNLQDVIEGMLSGFSVFQKTPIGFLADDLEKLNNVLGSGKLNALDNVLSSIKQIVGLTPGLINAKAEELKHLGEVLDVMSTRIKHTMVGDLTPVGIAAREITSIMNIVPRMLLGAMKPTALNTGGGAGTPTTSAASQTLTTQGTTAATPVDVQLLGEISRKMTEMITALKALNTTARNSAA